MTKKPSSYEPPLHLDMDFGEALERFARTEKSEADELAKNSKKKKLPRDKPMAAKGAEPD